MSTLNELIGSYDNLNEPTPWINERSTIYGLIIPTLVSKTTCFAYYPGTVKFMYYGES